MIEIASQLDWRPSLVYIQKSRGGASIVVVVIINGGMMTDMTTLFCVQHSDLF